MAASHDQSSRKTSTETTNTQTQVAASEASQTIATVATGDKNTTLGAGSQLFRGVKGDITFESIDPATIQGAFGLTSDVVEQLAALAGGYVQTASELSERSTAMVAEAHERFGADLSAITNRQLEAAAPDSGKNTIILALIGGGLALLFILLRRK